MTCSPMSLIEFCGLNTAAEIATHVAIERAADIRARDCRRLCVELDLNDALTDVLVCRAASERVVRASAHRFRAWELAIHHVVRIFWAKGKNHPSLPAYAEIAGDIVDVCIRLERAGLLERSI
jgi:hypothetical protein